MENIIGYNDNTRYVETFNANTMLKRKESNEENEEVEDEEVENEKIFSNDINLENFQHLEIVPTRDLIKSYNKCWYSNKNEQKENENYSNFIKSKKFDEGFKDLEFDENRFKKLIELNNEKFSCSFDFEEEFGRISKEDLEGPHEIYVRPDLHGGGLKDLLADFEALKEQGLLDENYKAKGNVRFIFLGDYVNRGCEDLQILELLITFRMENPKHVILMRGNHEYVSMNRYAKGKFKKFLLHNMTLLSNLYDTFYLAHYTTQVPQKTGSNREYILTAHAGPEITVDVTNLLNDNNSRATMIIPKDLQQLSDRVRNIEFDEKTDYEKLLLKKDLTKEVRKKLKLQQAAKRVTQLVEGKIYESWQFFSRITGCKTVTVDRTLYNWINITNEYDVTDIKSKSINLHGNDLKYILLLSSEHHKVKMLIRGHSHKKQKNYYEKKIENGFKQVLIAITLPVGFYSNKNCRAQNENGDPSSYIFTTAPKIKDWKKRAIDCGPFSPAKVSEKFPMYSDEI